MGKYLRLGVPFLTNPHHECVPTAMICGMRYLDKSLKLNRKELMRLMHQRPRAGAYLEQAAWALHRLKWDFTAYAAEAMDYGRPYSSHVTYLQAQKRGLVTYVKFTERDMRAALDAREMVVCMFDFNKMYGKKFGTSGHAVIMTGYDGDNFFFHENGSRHHGDKPLRHTVVSARRLEIARKAANYETIVLRGPRHALNTLTARAAANCHPQSGQTEGIQPDARPLYLPLDLSWRNGLA